MGVGRRLPQGPVVVRGEAARHPAAGPVAGRAVGLRGARQRRPGCGGRRCHERPRNRRRPPRRRPSTTIITMTGGYPVGPSADVDPDVPSPPRGPGVAPPFAAPPTDRSRKSLWIGLGVGALLLVLCCVGGVV